MTAARTSPSNQKRLLGSLRSGQGAWTALALALLALPLLPIATVVWLGAGLGDGSFAHLGRTVLPRALADTLWLVAGTSLITLVIGTATAWLVTMYRFPGRALLDRLLVLPFAMPAYILAYVYVDLLDFGGPVQTALRGTFGWRSAGEYWFPDIRSMPGAILILSLALYPYVYLSARASFVQQSVCVLEVARTLGRTPLGTLWSVALPLARPALAAGTALAAMEVLNDFGAMQHLGIGTLTVSVYATWFQRGSLAGAAQLALVALVLIGLLLWLEQRSRADARFHNTTGRWRSIPFQDLTGWRAGLAVAACALPVLLGFVLPAAFLTGRALGHLGQAADARFWWAAWNSIRLAAVVALVAVSIAVLVAYAGRLVRSRFLARAALIAGLGYALPGTVLALGLKWPLSLFDNGVDDIARNLFGVSTGLLVSGTILIVVLAHVIRFLAVALGAVDAGLGRLSPNLDAVARTLGETGTSVLRRVHLPLLVPALGTAGLLVFVDAMKELPATLLLRPFNFETLATHVYALVALEQIEAASLGALTIVVVGLVPVLLLHRAVAGGRAGG